MARSTACSERSYGLFGVELQFCNRHGLLLTLRALINSRVSGLLNHSPVEVPEKVFPGQGTNINKSELATAWLQRIK